MGISEQGISVGGFSMVWRTVQGIGALKMGLAFSERRDLQRMSDHCKRNPIGARIIPTRIQIECHETLKVYEAIFPAAVSFWSSVRGVHPAAFLRPTLGRRTGMPP